MALVDDRCGLLHANATRGNQPNARCAICSGLSVVQIDCA